MKALEGKIEKEPQNDDSQKFTAELLKFFLQGRIDAKNEIDSDYLEKAILKAKILSQIKIAFFDALKEDKTGKQISLGSDDNFVILSSFVANVFDFKSQLPTWIMKSNDVKSLEKSLVQFVKQSNSSIPDNLLEVICQCIMRFLSLSGKEFETIYDTWMQTKQNEMLNNKN